MRSMHLGFTVRRSAHAVSTLVLLFSVLFSPTHAELSVEEQDIKDLGTRTVYRMSVTPAPEPNPPLKYRLTIREIDLRPGNAATHYLRAFPESGFEGQVKRMVEEYGEEFYQWGRVEATPMHSLPLPQARKAASSFDFVVQHYIARATSRRDCDWGLGFEEMRGLDLLTVLLPEFNASRSVTRVLALRARVAIADGDYDRALDELRMSFRLAENVGREPLLVCGLIGIANASISQQQVIELIAADDSPNLYWAMAGLPQPLVDLRKAVGFDMSLGQRIFPFLLDAESASHTPEEWTRILSDALLEADKIDAGLEQALPVKGADREAVLEFLQQLMPHAKQRLLQGGIDERRLEKMSVGQVVAIDAAREYQRMTDDMEKWMLVPHHVPRTRKNPTAVDQNGETVMTRGFGFMLARLLLPAVEAARTAQFRLQWQSRGIQVVEAIRMHAAQSGELPQSLDDITLVHVPVNPTTNQPYQYRVADQVGVLELPFSDGIPDVAWRFEITLDETE